MFSPAKPFKITLNCPWSLYFIYSYKLNIKGSNLTLLCCGFPFPSVCNCICSFSLELLLDLQSPHFFLTSIECQSYKKFRSCLLHIGRPHHHFITKDIKRYQWTARWREIVRGLEKSWAQKTLSLWSLGCATKGQYKDWSVYTDIDNERVNYYLDIWNFSGNFGGVGCKTESRKEQKWRARKGKI